jgi:hypothetical protein
MRRDPRCSIPAGLATNATAPATASSQPGNGEPDAARQRIGRLADLAGPLPRGGAVRVQQEHAQPAR